MEAVVLPSQKPTDRRLFRELMDKFTVLAEACARLSQEVYRRADASLETDTEDRVKRNLKISRSVFSKQSLETLAVIYMYNALGFAELRRTLGPIGAPFLRAKLRRLEEGGFVQRDDASKELKDARFSLTHKGLMIARLGEPVFLYLRLADGWRHSSTDAEGTGDGETPPTPGDSGT